MGYVYDRRKRARVLRDHGVDLADCEAVLYDPNAVSNYYEEGGEERCETIGMDAQARLTTLQWTQRGEDCRAITAWRATKSEEVQYHEG